MQQPSLLAAGARSALSFSAAPVQIQAQADPNAVPRFRLTAYTGEPMRIWPWDSPVVVDLESIDLSVQSIPALYDHVPDVSHVVGQVESVSVEGGQLVAAGRFVVTDGADYARQVLDRARAGYQWQASVGGDPTTVEQVQAGQSIAVNDRIYQGPVAVARGVVLREISFVVLGGDRRTNAVVARHGNRVEGITVDFETWVLSLGFDPASLTEQQNAAMQIAFANMQEANGGETPAENGAMDEDMPPTNAQDGEAPPVPDEEETPTNAGATPPAIQGRQADPAVLIHRQAIAAEEQRIASVRRICGRYGDPEITVGRQRVNLQVHAIGVGWDTTRTELEALRASRSAGPGVISRDRDRDCSLQALQGAMLLRAGARLDNPAYQTPAAVEMRLPDWLRAGINAEQRQRAMEAAHRYSDMSLVDLCRESLRLDGRDAPQRRDEMIRAAFSGGTLTNIFTTNVNAVLMASYLEAKDTTEGWTTTVDVADFKSNERPRVKVGGGLKKLPRGGTADHADFADTVESYKIARYAKQFQIDEQDVIDDRLGALSDTPRRLGIAAARLRPDIVYAIILNGASAGLAAGALFDHTAYDNVNSSHTFAADTLKSAIKLVQLCQENSVNLNLEPTHLIVPPALRFDAAELLNSTAVAAVGTAGAVTIRGTANVLQGLLELVSDARLENGVTDPSDADESTYSGSASNWYLASTMAHTIEVAYLRGTGRAPRVRSFTLERGQYGVGWDVNLDIGAKALDWRGLWKFTT